ncbi:MAG: HNH endonuclease [Candidatus Saccharimonadota bacterium]
MIECTYCRKKLDHQKKFCSNKCQNDFQYSDYIEKWKSANVNGLRGRPTFNLSSHLVRYIRHKYQNRCARCEWSIVNKFTLQIPLEIDHIDGDSSNNSESNLILLCPNCHSLTKTYKNANKGNGRLWRREKYVKINDVPL